MAAIMQMTYIIQVLFRLPVSKFLLSQKMKSFFLPIFPHKCLQWDNALTKPMGSDIHYHLHFYLYYTIL